MNHDFGFARNWARPDEGDAERDDKPGEEGVLGARVSAGGASALGEGTPLRRFMLSVNPNPARILWNYLCK